MLAVDRHNRRTTIFCVRTNLLYMRLLVSDLVRNITTGATGHTQGSQRLLNGTDESSERIKDTLTDVSETHQVSDKVHSFTCTSLDTLLDQVCISCVHLVA